MCFVLFFVVIFYIKCYSHWKQAHEEDLMLPVQEMWDYSRSSSLMERGEDRKFPESHFRLSPCRESDWQPENRRPAAGPAADLAGKVRRLKVGQKSPPRQHAETCEGKTGIFLSFKCFFFSTRADLENWDLAVFLNRQNGAFVRMTDPTSDVFWQVNTLNMLLKLISHWWLVGWIRSFVD